MSRNLDRAIRRKESELADVQRKKEQAYSEMQRSEYGSWDYREAARRYSTLCAKVDRLESELVSMEYQFVLGRIAT